MKIRELLKRRVIELIHGLPYDEAIKKELGFGCKILCKEFCGDCEDIVGDYNTCNDFDCDIKQFIIDYREDFQPFDSDESILLKGLGEYKIHQKSNVEFTLGIIENVVPYYKGKAVKIIGLPITIGRVMKALGQDGQNCYDFQLGYGGNVIQHINIHNLNHQTISSLKIEWKLINEDGSECTDDDQTDETIEKLYNLIK